MRGAPISGRARLYESVRTAHLERALELEPATIVYQRRRYDFDESLAGRLPLVQTTRRGLFGLFLRSDVTQLEVNEPLLGSAAVSTALALAAIRLRGIITRRRPLVVSYAIENLEVLTPPDAKLRTRLRMAAERRLARAIHARLDRIAFGTTASAELYASIFRRPRHQVITTIPALPTPRASAGRDRNGSLVVFVGALVERKGIPLLMSAWSAVEERLPEARLLVLGKGPLAEEVRRLSERSTSVSFVDSPTRAQIWAHLDSAQVLVLPSQPAPGWREQIGLPILEGLSAGCSIVTTEETGLAVWLREHGHAVVAADSDARLLALAVVEQLELGRSARSVVADLPPVDGRLAADRWLFADGGVVS